MEGRGLERSMSRTETVKTCEGKEKRAKTAMRVRKEIPSPKMGSLGISVILIVLLAILKE